MTLPLLAVLLALSRAFFNLPQRSMKKINRYAKGQDKFPTRLILARGRELPLK
jgi:hypothetical protein